MPVLLDILCFILYTNKSSQRRFHHQAQGKGKHNQKQAQNAANSASTATASKNAAVAAQGKAEAAQTAAETAQGKAEDAQAAAESSAQAAARSETDVENRLAGCVINYKDATGATTSEKYLHW